MSLGGLNPITAIEKVINEHGSAVILKERLELAADKYSMLERTVEKLKCEKQELETANKELSVPIQQYKSRIDALELELKKTIASTAPKKNAKFYCVS